MQAEAYKLLSEASELLEQQAEELSSSKVAYSGPALHVAFLQSGHGVIP